MAEVETDKKHEVGYALPTETKVAIMYITYIIQYIVSHRHANIT